MGIEGFKIGNIVSVNNRCGVVTDTIIKDDESLYLEIKIIGCKDESGKDDLKNLWTIDELKSYTGDDLYYTNDIGFQKEYNSYKIFCKLFIYKIDERGPIFIKVFKSRKDCEDFIKSLNINFMD